jgi:hypothetical protein
VLSRPPQLQSQIPLLSRSRRRPSSLKWPPPGRRPGLRSLSPNLQQPPSGLLGSQRRKQPRVSKPWQPNPQPPNWWSPPNLPPHYSRISLISSIPSPSRHVWS